MKVCITIIKRQRYKWFCIRSVGTETLLQFVQRNYFCEFRKRNFDGRRLLTGNAAIRFRLVMITGFAMMASAPIASCERSLRARGQLVDQDAPNASLGGAQSLRTNVTFRITL